MATRLNKSSKHRKSREKEIWEGDTILKGIQLVRCCYVGACFDNRHQNIFHNIGLVENMNGLTSYIHSTKLIIIIADVWKRYFAFANVSVVANATVEVRLNVNVIMNVHFVFPCTNTHLNYTTCFMSRKEQHHSIISYWEERICT